MRLPLTGDFIGAEGALRIGLIEEIWPPGEESKRAGALAVATVAVEAAVRGALKGNLELGLRIENELKASCFAKGGDAQGASLFASREGKRTE